MASNPLSLGRMAIRSLWFFWRTNLALLLGIAVGTAVLTGALLVGDSIRQSLQSLTLERLGRIDEILIGEQFFHESLVDALRAQQAPSATPGDVPRTHSGESSDKSSDETATESPIWTQHYDQLLPAILINGATVEHTQGQIGRVVSRKQGVTLLGCTPDFWSLDITGLPELTLARDQIAISALLAEELRVVVGDRVLVRIGKPSGVASDSPLASKDDLVQTLADLEVVQIIPSHGLGRFSLSASQQVPANAFVAIETLQRGLDREAQVNAILVAGGRAESAPPVEAFSSLTDSLRPQLSDLGLALKRVTLASGADDTTQPVLTYDALSNDRMLFSPQATAAVEQACRELGLAAAEVQPVLTYLATRIEKLDSAGTPTGEVVAYSTVSGVDSITKLGPLLHEFTTGNSADASTVTTTTESNQAPFLIADDEIVLNSWTAGVLQAKVGDRVRLTYFEPETTYGEVVEQHVDLTLQGIAKVTEPERPYSSRPRRPATFRQAPTLANDPDLTPEVPGITDQDSIANWDAPFPIDHDLLGRRDDVYWDNYRTTPKAFVSLNRGRQLWRSRFGETTSYRLPITESETAVVTPSDNQDRAARLESLLRNHLEAFGLRWLRAKEDGLRASKGTTPFDALFFGFSMFIISAALMLVTLLLRLNLEQRASQLGLLGAIGFNWKRSRRLLLLENVSLVTLGSALGVVLGIAYAWLMLAGLRSWWVAAVVTPFMHLAIRPVSLLAGFLLGMVASLATIAWTVGRMRLQSASNLLAGGALHGGLEIPMRSPLRQALATYAPWGLLALALLLGAIAPGLAPEPQGLAFFGAGACVLAAILITISSRLRRASQTEGDGGDLTLQLLASRNLARNPGRSTLTIGLVAAACFLIVAISAFRLAPTDAGTGGFELVGTSDLPIFADLQDAATRQEMGFANESLTDVGIYSLRFQEGDDASCRNLYQSSRPQLIGVPPSFIENAPLVGTMEWAGFDKTRLTARDTDESPPASPWTVLLGGDTDDGAIPVVLDKNTAMYGMHLFGGVGEEFERDYGTAGVLRFRVVGLFAGSIFQGSLMVPEAALLKHFPRVGGYRFFLVDANGGPEKVAAALENAFGDMGLDLTDTKRLLTELLAVQNTYLSTFQSLGGLGLLLGTFGLAAVQLRNILQRRGEFALMQATGFGNDRLSLLVFREHALLLFGGLGVGTLAAIVVVLPHVLFGGASIPVLSLLMTLGLVAVVGLASGLFAQRQLHKAPLLDALRGD